MAETAHPPVQSRPASAAGDVIARVRALGRTRGGLGVLVAYALTALVCAFLPLADHLGFELALALATVAALAAPAAGIAAMRLELARDENERRPVRAAFAASLFSVGALAIPAALILLNGLRRPVCDAGGGSLWLLTLPLPTAWLAAALGAVARARAETVRGAIWRVSLIEGLSLAVSLAALYTGPSFFLYDHFFGYYPGPLYDEIVALSPTLLAFRAMTLLWGVAAMLACGALDGPEGSQRPAAFAAALLAGALVATTLTYGERAGYRSTDRSVAAALGGVREIDNLEIHFPREWDERAVERFVRDAAFRASQVERALGVEPDRKVRVWLYRSTEEKRRLVGAAATSFAKPWRREIHIHASGFPHPVLRHELVHAIAGQIAGGPFGTPGGLVPNSPLVEGFAVAYDAESEGMTTLEWAKAMRDLKVAPDIGALLTPAGFLSAAPARAYTYAGAFLRHLEATHGRDKVLELYRSGDLARLGEPAALVAGFEAALDRVTVGPDERAAAERRFARPSVFRRTCAREVSQLTADAREQLSAGRKDAALATFESACELEPDDPALLRGLLTASIDAGDASRRDAVAERLFAHPKLDATLRAAALVELGDAAWKRDELELARARYTEAAALTVDANTHRSAVARLRAVSDPPLASLLRGLLVEQDAGLDQLFRMDDHLREHPDDALVLYLLGRQFVQRDAIERGLVLLARAHAAGLGDRELVRENLRLLARGAAELQRCEQADTWGAALQASGGSASDAAYVADWTERCRYASARGWEPL